MSVNFLATSVPSEPEDFAGTSGFYPIDRTSVGVLLKSEWVSHYYLYYSIKINLRSRKIAKSKKSRCEGCRPPRVANEGSMDRPFYGVGQGDKKIHKSGSTG